MNAIAHRRSLVSTYVGLLAAAALVAARPLPARAQAPNAAPPAPTAKPPGAEKEAVAAFKEGKKAFDAGNFLLALEHFSRANRLIPGAAPRFMLGQANEKLGRTTEAVAAYRSFLELAPDPASTYGKRIPEAKARLAELERQLPAQLIVNVLPLDVQPVLVVDGVAGKQSPLTLAPGQHTIVVTSAGYRPRTETVAVSSAERRELSVALEAEVARVAPLPFEGPKRRRTIFGGPVIACLGVAGATAVAGTVFGGLALAEQSRFNAEPSEDSADAAERNAVLSDVFFGTALASGAAAAVLMFVGSDDDGVARHVPRFSPWVGASGAVAVARWSY
ncbi:MAG: hypothetical protein FJ096_16275 [Deltaproteobacteria bacterium]|nr:hypothetical protein [Deltaproteobacteria bacterium]